MSGDGKGSAAPGGDRPSWTSKTEYVLLVAGNALGLGNVWRFPYLCYKYGGGSFLMPYTLLAAVCGIPLYLLETSSGQYAQEGFLTCWRKLCPLAQGIGYGHLVMKLYDFSYILIKVWALFYLASSFTSRLPWTSCDNTWNTADCVDLRLSDSAPANATANRTARSNFTTAAEEFWERRVLAASGGIEELGAVRWELALCLLTCWVFCYFQVWRGVRAPGKLAYRYFSTICPYVMLLIMFIRGMTFPGAVDGICFFIFPKLSRLGNLEAWVEAGSQICFSYSLAVGTAGTLSSYNTHSNNCYKDSFWLCQLNNVTRFLAGLVVFSVLGAMARTQGVAIDAVAEAGPGLIFVTYSQVTATLPLPQLWAVCFFFMIISLSVDTHFVAMECFVSAVVESFPKLLRAPGRSETFALLVCAFFFLLHLSLVTEGGIYVFQLIDYYGCSRACHYFMVFAECLALAWSFGADRLFKIIEDVAGKRPCLFMKLSWKYITPPLALICFVLYLIGYPHLQVGERDAYPAWAYALGRTMTLSSVLMVPLWAAGQMCVTAGTFRQRLSTLCRPADAPARRPEDTPLREEEEEGAEPKPATSALKRLNCRGGAV